MDLQKCIDASMSYSEYIELIDSLLLEEKTTGPDQSPSMLNYGKLNRHRMGRLDKTLAIEPTVAARLQEVTAPQIWLVITEGWCGDAAQNIPVIEKAAAVTPQIETRYVLRDENTELMDQFLTNGARSIPKLIAIDRSTKEVLWTWGPRPGDAQKYYFELKASGAEKSEIAEQMQRWYNVDKGRSAASELAELAAEVDIRFPLAAVV